jgi:hypothetical protein
VCHPRQSPGLQAIVAALSFSAYQLKALNMNNPVTDLPGWGEMPKRSGMYLSLTHGRDFPQQVVKARGFGGPKIGPLLYVQTLYAQKITLRFANRRDAKRFFPDTTLTINSLEVIEGTLVYGDKCYGNWDVCFIAEEFCQ